MLQFLTSFLPLKCCCEAVTTLPFSLVIGAPPPGLPHGSNISSSACVTVEESKTVPSCKKISWLQNTHVVHYLIPPWIPNVLGRRALGVVLVDSSSNSTAILDRNVCRCLATFPLLSLLGWDLSHG